jgi:DNA-directed RNA polymerase subunit RPC12/RpoP
MLSINDFLDENLRVNWSAYRQAQRDAGETCSRCDGRILVNNGSPTVCYNCRLLGSDQVSSNQFIRCPYCSHQFNAWSDDEFSDLWTQGFHSTFCTECNCEFEFETKVMHVFVSPRINNCE